MNTNNELNKHLPAPAIEKFLANQEKEIALKNIEIELAKQKDKHSFEYATKALETTKNDRDAHRQACMEVGKSRIRFAMFALVVIAAFLLFTMYLGKDQIAMEILKIIAYVAVGGIGGYSVGRTRKASDD